MTIEYPGSNDGIDRIIECALTHPTYLDGLIWLLEWDTARAIEQHKKHTDGTYDTFSRYFIREYTRLYLVKYPGTNPVMFAWVNGA